MAIVYPSAFNRRPAAGFDGVFDWDFLDPAWQRHITRITPMDFDAVVERNGRKLGFETKDPGVPIQPGQRWTIRSTIRSGDWDWIILHAKTPAEIIGWEFWWLHEGRIVENHVDGDADALVKFCARWFARASDGVHLPAYYKYLKGRADLFSSRMTDEEVIRHIYFERFNQAQRDAFLEAVFT